MWIEGLNQNNIQKWCSGIERKNWLIDRIIPKLNSLFKNSNKIDFSSFENTLDSEELKEICKDAINDWTLKLDEEGKIVGIYVDVSWEKRSSKLFNSLVKAWLSSEQALKSRLQVRTKNFRNRFGDRINDHENASKIVDENGEPLLVYHGSPRKFENFDADKIGSTTGDKSGFYFSNNKGIAKSYYSKETGNALNNIKLMLGVSKEYKSTVYACFIRAMNPYIYDFWGEVDKIGREKLIADAKNAGHDSAILKNIIDWPSVVQDVYIAFTPDQIKVEVK